MRTTYTFPAYRERGPVEIMFDFKRIAWAPDVFPPRNIPALSFFDRRTGAKIATVPYRDRDREFLREDNAEFRVAEYADASVHRYIPGDMPWYAKCPLQIAFRARQN